MSPTRRLCSSLLVCLFIGVGLTISGCDSGGSNSNKEAETNSSAVDVDQVGSTATVRVTESTKSNASSTRGIVTVLFFYGKKSDGTTCFASESTEITTGTTKRIGPARPACADGPKEGISVHFTVLSGSTSGLTLELRGEEGTVVASASSSDDDELNVEAGNVPSDDNSSNEGSNAKPAWVGNWVITSIDGNQPPVPRAFKATESQLIVVRKDPNTGRCDSFAEPITDRERATNTITLFDDEDLEFKVSVSNETLTATGISDTVNDPPTITAKATSETLAEAINCSIDTDPPSSPSGLTSTAGDGYVSLRWDVVTEESVRYYVYRSTSPIDDVSGRTPLDSSPSAPGVFVDASARNGTTYYYAVTAIDRNRNESPASSSASATPNENHSGSPPSDLTGNWKVVEFYHAERDTTRPAEFPLYYSITKDHFTVVSERTNRTCDAHQVSIVVEDNRVMIGSGSNTQAATFDISDGRLTLSPLGPRRQNERKIIAKSVDSDPRDILECSSSTKSTGQSADSTPWGL